jgi:hypothetical protein
VCGQRFRAAAALQEHVADVHPDRAVPDEQAGGSMGDAASQPVEDE